MAVPTPKAVGSLRERTGDVGADGERSIDVLKW
jgi:hypothetical protein